MSRPVPRYVTANERDRVVANAKVINGHKAINCLPRIEVSTLLDGPDRPRYIHGDCDMPKYTAPEPSDGGVKFTFTSGGREYTVIGTMRSFERDYGSAAPGPEFVTVRLFGKVTSEPAPCKTCGHRGE